MTPTMDKMVRAWLTLGAVISIQAAPRIPMFDGETLTTVRTSLTKSEAEAVRRMRQPGARPGSLPDALPLVRNLIQLARSEADPRYLTQARAVLAPWWDMPDAPVEVLLLRATIRQSRHDFDGSLADLEEVLRRDPQNGQAWLTRAVVLTVRGDYGAAREACFHAMRFSNHLAATTAAAALGGLTGGPGRAYALLKHALSNAERGHEQLGAEERSVRVWALLTLGDLAEQSGSAADTEAHYAAALVLEPRDPAVLAAWADFLLSQGRQREVVAALREFERIDALLLRLAEAERELQSLDSTYGNDASRHFQMLRDRFAAAHLRGDNLHLREEARFELRLGGNAKRAFRLARQNWETQKERADARVLLEAAESAGDREALDAVRNFFNGGAKPATTTATGFAP